MNILALDVGTSSIKAAVLNTAEPTALATPVEGLAQVPYTIDYPQPDGAEVSAEHLWNAVDQAARRAIALAPKSRWPIEGVGLSCLMPALVLLDQADRVLSPIWIHLDRRSRAIARQLWTEQGEEFLQTIGNRPLPGGVSALCYAQQVRESPQLRQQVRHYLHANGWLALKLTGERAFDRGNACFTGLFDTMTQQQWSPRWCAYFEVEPQWLPRVVCGTTTLGGLRAEIAADWGLPSGLPVKLGTADTSSAMLAAGMQSGDLLHSVGTTQVLATFVAQPKPDPRRLTRLLGVGDSFIYVAHNPVGGAALGWLHQLAFRDQTKEEFFSKTISLAWQRRTEVRLAPPFLGGDRLEIEARRAAFVDLTLGTDRLDLLSAVLLAMSEGHREALRAIERHEGDLGRIFLTGGGAEVLRLLLPEYAGERVQRIDEAALRGVARLFAA